VLREAMSRRAIDAAAAKLDALSAADLVVLAAPVCQNIVLLKQVSTHLSPSAVVTDVGGTKRAIVDAAGSLPREVRFVGGHPLGGGARGGFEFATASLFARRAAAWMMPSRGCRLSSAASARIPPP
jgi:prephenate dehydrogenase